MTLTFDRLTVKLVCESHLRRGTFFPNLGTLDLRVLELFAMYATDGQTDGRTDGQTQSLLPSSLQAGGGNNGRAVKDACERKCFIAHFIQPTAVRARRSQRTRDRSVNAWQILQGVLQVTTVFARRRQPYSADVSRPKRFNTSSFLRCCRNALRKRKPIGQCFRKHSLTRTFSNILLRGLSQRSIEI